jgi:hypothetical protein
MRTRVPGLPDTGAGDRVVAVKRFLDTAPETSNQEKSASELNPYTALNVTRVEPGENSTLVAVVDLLVQAEALVIRECSLHADAGRRWLTLPVRPVVDDSGLLLKDASGRFVYKPIITLPDAAAAEAFQREALQAIDEALGKGAP